MNNKIVLRKYKNLIISLICAFLIIANGYIWIAYPQHPPKEFPRLDNTVGSSLSNDEYYREYWEIPHVKEGEELQFYYHIGNYTETKRTIRISVFVDYVQQPCKINGEWKKVHMCTIRPDEYQKIPVIILCQNSGEHELFVWSRLRSYEDSPQIDTLFYDNSFIAKTPKVKIIVEE
jgi:hypothetical protein